MKTVALEGILADAILWFCENLAELGCPKNEKNPDMWYRYLSEKERLKVADKLLSIVERDTKRLKEEDKSELKAFCPRCNKRKMKNGELVGCKRLTQKAWNSGFIVDDKKMFNQKNCPLLKMDKQEMVQLVKE